MRSATTNAARMMSIPDIGQIKKGFQADIIVINGNPLEDIHVLAKADENVSAVFKGGRLCRDNDRTFGGGLLDTWAKL